MAPASARFWWGFCLSRVSVGGSISFSWKERLSPLEEKGVNYVSYKEM